MGVRARAFLCALGAGLAVLTLAATPASAGGRLDLVVCTSAGCAPVTGVGAGVPGLLYQAQLHLPLPVPPTSICPRGGGPIPGVGTVRLCHGGDFSGGSSREYVGFSGEDGTELSLLNGSGPATPDATRPSSTMLLSINGNAVGITTNCTAETGVCVLD